MAFLYHSPGAPSRLSGILGGSLRPYWALLGLGLPVILLWVLAPITGPGSQNIIMMVTTMRMMMEMMVEMVMEMMMEMMMERPGKKDTKTVRKRGARKGEKRSSIEK